MSARRVVLRGDKFSIARALADAGIPFAFVRSTGSNTVGDVPIAHCDALGAFLGANPGMEGRYAKGSGK